MNKNKKIILFFFSVFILLGLGVTAYLSFVYQSQYKGKVTHFEVKNGDTFGKINQRLFERGLISNKRFFHYLTRSKGALTKFRAGTFTIAENATMPEILDVLLYGKVDLETVTIPEGKNIYEVAKIFDKAGISNEGDFLKEAKSLEGYLYPETYRFALNTPAKVVVKAMRDLFQTKTSNIDFKHPFLSKHEIIILASMVEKETGAKVERPAIAGVFLNRLKKKMRLESDPTTIYGIWKSYKGNLKRSDLITKTPYNTYKISALPIGPIANPSTEAINAVIKPQNHDYLFFVSRNDGTHIFTRNYLDHQNAVNNFQKNVKARKGKSWRQLEQ